MCISNQRAGDGGQKAEGCRGHAAQYSYRSNAKRENAVVGTLCPVQLTMAHALSGRGAPETAFTRSAWGRPLPPARSADKNLSSALCSLFYEGGISLIELIMFIVIVSVGLAGIMLVMDVTTKSSADPGIRKQALAVAESLLEEIELQDFLDNGFSGPYTQANRASFDDVMDYNGFTTNGVYPANGGALAVSGLQNYDVDVAVTALVWDNIPSASAVQITVTVTGPSGQSLDAMGYRVAY